MQNYLAAGISAIGAQELGGIIGGILALVLLVGVPILFVVSLIKTIRKRGAIWIVLLVLSSILGLFLLIGLISAGVSGFNMAIEKAREASLSKETRTVVSDDGLVALDAPGNWKEAPGLSAEAELGLMDEAKEQYALVMTESKEDFDLSDLGGLEGYGDLILELMTENLENGDLGKWESGKGHEGLPFRSIEFRGTVTGVRIVYFLTVYQTEDHFHQLLQWSIPSNWDAAEPVFKKVLRSFRLKKSDKEKKPN